MQGTTTNQGADQTLTPKAQRWCGCGPWGGGYRAGGRSAEAPTACPIWAGVHHGDQAP